MASSLTGARKPPSAGLHKAHAHPCGVASGLAGQPFGAGPAYKALVVIAGFGVLGIAMRTPAVLIFGAGELRAAAQLRTAGKAAREIGLLPLVEGRDDVTAAHLVAEEM